MNLVWLIAFFAGLSVGIIIGVLIDRDTLLKVGKIKFRGRNYSADDVLDINLTRRERRRRRRANRR